MRIARIAPLFEAVPPTLYGGTERIVAYLSDALADLGHDVTLFPSGDSNTIARLVTVRDRAIRLDSCGLRSDVAAHLSMLHEIRRRAHRFDVLHFHTQLLHFPIFEDHAERTLTTLHGHLDLNKYPGGLPPVATISAGVDFECAAIAIGARELAGHGFAWFAGEPATVFTWTRPIPRISWQDASREAA
jgi:glycosyltransferase involved in cell wall biosynthesis